METIMVSVNPELASGGKFLLPYEQMNRAGELLAMARGIAACVGAAAQHENELPEFSITQACYALSGLLDEVEKITEMKGTNHGA
jgi:hypothetical protein